MSWLDVIERRFRRFAIPNLTGFLAGFQGALWLLAVALPRPAQATLFDSFVLIPEKVWEGEVWRLLTFVFLPPGLGDLAIFGIYSSDSVGALLFWLCLGGAATAALSLNLYAIAQMFAGPRAVGTWVGIQNAVGNLSGIFGPIITGVMIDQAGYGSAFYLTAGVALFGALWWAFAVPAIRQIALD